jgi:hypothetical protein
LIRAPEAVKLTLPATVIPMVIVVAVDFVGVEEYVIEVSATALTAM